MMNRLLPLLLMLSVIYWSAEGFMCVPCKQVKCRVVTGCSWGVTKDVCDCCSKCSNGPGDMCGGPLNVYGPCGDGLYCDRNINDIHSDGECKEGQELYSLRSKRNLAATRKAGLARVRARQHQHNDYAGIPDHIRQMLLLRGIKV